MTTIGAHAVHYHGAGGLEVIKLGVLPDSHLREPAHGEVAVAVAAVGLNRADILQRRGFYPAPPGVEANVPGLEYAGLVDAVGSGVSLAVGAPVMGIIAGGACSTRVVVPANETVSVPNNMPLESAAAIPEAFFTAYDALIVNAKLTAGQRVLIHAAASGVGSAAVQIARHAAAIIVGTSRTAAKLDGLDLDLAIVCGEPLFADAVREALGNRGVDVVLDLVGGAYLAENLRVLDTRGRMIVIGLLGGIRAELSLATLLAKRLEIRGSVLRSQGPAEKAALAAAFRANVVPLFDTGELVPVIDRVMPITEIADAHRLLESNATAGKIVLTW